MTTIRLCKRKAIDLIDGDTEEDIAKNIKTTAIVLKNLIKTSGKNAEKLQEVLSALATHDDLNSFDQSLEAIARVSDNEEDNWGDDDDTSIEDAQDAWSVMFRQLREYRMTNGDCKVHAKENKKLHQWTKDQKKLYGHLKAGKSNSLKPERIAKLESIGFGWGKKYPDPPTWDEMFEKLSSFKKRTGDCNVPFNENNPTPLAKWIANQRYEYRRYRKGMDYLITDDQMGRLDGIGFKWKKPK